MEQSIKQRIADIRHGNVPAGYRKTKLGIIPADWNVELLGAIFIARDERVDNSADTPLFSLTIENGITEKTERYEREFLVKKEKNYKKVYPGDFVYNPMNLRFGAIARYHGSTPCSVSGYYDVFYLKNPGVGDFIENLLQSDFLLKEYSNAATGSLIEKQRVHFCNFCKINIAIPPIKELLKVAEILGCCDRVITLKKELIAEKKKQKKALMQKLLNPDSGFRLPVIREKITQVHFNDICRFINGRAYSQDELLETGKYRVLRVGNLFTSDTWYFSNLELLNDKYCQKDDLLYAWSASFGPFIWQGETTIYHYHIWKVEPCEHVDKMFLYHCLKYDAELLENSIQGGTMSHITKETMERRLCPFVDNLDLQKNIADILSAADKEIDLLEQELAQQEQKKKSLMQLLLTGIVRV